MPKVTINEIDQSRYVQSGASAPMVVLVPGTASFGPVFNELNPSVVSFSGAAGLQSFYRTFGYNPATVTKYTNDGVHPYLATIDEDLSFEYVTNLLNNGATVQFVRINEGVKAATNKIISTSSDVGSSDVKFTARHSGRFGNYLVVQISNVKILYDNTTAPDKQEVAREAVISVYMTTPKFANAHNSNTTYDTSKLTKLTLLEGYRVSTDPTSVYFSNLTAFEYLSDITINDLTSILKTYNEETNIAYALFGGADFAVPVSNSDTYTELTECKDEDTILEMLLDKLSYKLTDGENTSIYANFTDPYLFDFDFVTSSGFVTETCFNDLTSMSKDPIHRAMITLCEARGDCTALLDTPKNLAAINASKAIDGTTGMPNATVSEYAKLIDTSYAAIYAPWCSVVSASTAAILEMPPSYIFISAILKGMSTSLNNDLWYVPAGVTRAAAPFIISPRYEIGSVILDEFQNSKNYRVNPIMKVRNYGYCVYGNSTCLQSIPGVSRSALESMNVRLLCNVIKKTIFAVCSSLAFEYNDSRLWAKFYSQMDKVLIYMKRNYGLYDYKIIMDGTTVTSQAMNERRVPGKIMISPTLAGEYFDIDFEIAPSGVSFSEEA